MVNDLVFHENLISQTPLSVFMILACFVGLACSIARIVYERNNRAIAATDMARYHSRAIVYGVSALFYVFSLATGSEEMSSVVSHFLLIYLVIQESFYAIIPVINRLAIERKRRKDGMKEGGSVA